MVLAVRATCIEDPGRPVTSLTLSLIFGWHPEPPFPGDIVLVEVTGAPPDLIGPRGWARLDGESMIFWKVIQFCEPDPKFISRSECGMSLDAYSLPSGTFTPPEASKP